MRGCVALALALVAIIPVPAASVALDEDRVVLTPRDAGVIFEVEAIPARVASVCEPLQPGPFHAKYRGALEIVPQRSGKLRIINEVSFPDYLAGIAEVPLSWPAAALRAQVIAARSYAMDAYTRGRSAAGERGYHICSTVNCQVYRGAAVELGAFGERWLDAIRATRGRVLRYRDRIVQAFYFSTSNGRTRTSFPGGSPIPWARSVDGMDGAAPLGRWRAPIPLSDLARMLGTPHSPGDDPPWTGGRILRVEDRGDAVRLVGSSGASTMTKPTFTASVNVRSRCIFPDRYPHPRGSQAGTRLPSTIPSSSFTARMHRDRVVIRGRGWGHFIGMSQWGAYAMARRGSSAGDILDHFYGSATIGRVAEPAAIRVLAAEDLRQVRIRIVGRAAVTTGRGSELAPGRRFTITRGDPPAIRRGRGPRARDVLVVRPLMETVRVPAGAGSARLRFEASRPVRLFVRITDDTGSVVTTSRERSFEAGERATSVTLSAGGEPLPPGTYGAVLEATDGLDTVRTPPVTLVIGTVPHPSASATPTERALPVAAAAAALLIALAGLALWLSRR